MTRPFTYSEFSTAVQCLRKYQLQYIDKIVPREALETLDLAFGTCIHSGINAFFDKEDGIDYFELLWESNKGLPSGRYSWDDYADMGPQFLSRFNRLHLKHFEPKVREVRYSAQFKGMPLEGTPDFVGTYRGKRVVMDWKTSAYQYPKEKRLTCLQLYLYAYLAQQNLGFQPEALGYLVFNKGAKSIQTLTFDFDSDLQKDLLDNMYDYWYTISKSERFPKNPNACMMGTNRCAFFNHCWRKE